MPQIPSYPSVNAMQVDDDDQFVLNVDGTTSSMKAKDVAQMYSDFVALTGTTWDGTNKVKTATANVVLTFAPGNNRLGQLIFIQDATGGRTLTIDGNSIPVDTTANAVNFVSFIYDAVSSQCYFLVATAVLALAGGGDTTAPVLSTATVEDSTPNEVWLNYNEAIDTGSVPSTTDFVVRINTVPDTITGVSIVGTKVTVELTSNVVSGDDVEIDYTPGTNPIRDLAGNNAAALSAQTVTNNVAGYDTDAQAFFTASGITGTTEKNALDRFFRDIKGQANGSYTTYDLWTAKLKDAWLFAGSNAMAAGMSINLSGNDWTFNGVWTHDANGSASDGNSGSYGNGTGIIPSSYFAADSAYAGVFIKNSLAGGEKIAFGANDGSGGLWIKPKNAGGNMAIRINDGAANEVGVPTTAGYSSARRAGAGACKFMKDGVVQSPFSNTEYLTGYEIYLGCMNNSGSEYGNAAFINQALILAENVTDAEDTFLFNAITALNTALGR